MDKLEYYIMEDGETGEVKTLQISDPEAIKTDTAIAFTEADTKSNIESGENIPTLFGKIKKWFKELKAVAFSGSYNDLDNKPDLKTVATSGDYNDLDNKPDLKDVATSGDYADLINTPDVFSTTTNGLVPMSTDVEGFLKGDGTWVVPKGGTDQQFLTWEEWEALPDTKFTDNIRYIITDKTYRDGIIQDDKTGDTITWSSNKIVDYISSVSPDVSGKLDKTGGNMTGNIGYTGSKATYNMIKFIDNNADTYGNGISIGGGGLTIIGGGESADVIASQHTSGGDENMVIANDNAIDFFSNCQNGYSSSKHMTMETDGTLTLATSGIVQAGNSKAVTGAIVHTALSGKQANLDIKSRKTATTQTHTGWTNNATDDYIVPSMSFMAYWNGAYSSGGASNLAYCNKGAFGDLVNDNAGSMPQMTSNDVEHNFKQSNFGDPWSGVGCALKVRGKLAVNELHVLDTYNTNVPAMQKTTIWPGVTTSFTVTGYSVYLFIASYQASGWQHMYIVHCNSTGDQVGATKICGNYNWSFTRSGTTLTATITSPQSTYWLCSLIKLSGYPGY